MASSPLVPRPLRVPRDDYPSRERIARQVGLKTASAARVDLVRALAAERAMTLERDLQATLEGERLNLWSQHLEAALVNAAAGGDYGMQVRVIGRLLQISQIRMTLGELIEPPIPEHDEVDEIRARAMATLRLVPGWADDR